MHVLYCTPLMKFPQPPNNEYAHHSILGKLVLGGLEFHCQRERGSYSNKLSRMFPKGCRVWGLSSGYMIINAIARPPRLAVRGANEKVMACD